MQTKIEQSKIIRRS